MKLEKPIDLGRSRERARNRIHRIGIELEGGWTKLPRGCKPVRDGSIHLDRHPLRTQMIAIGEVPSTPMSLDPRDPIHWIPWLRTFYPQLVNETCGMHVHLSFRTALTYARLMSPNYPSTIVAYMTKWAASEKLGKDHPIWPRLEGKSEYCQHLFHADDQVILTGKDYDHHRKGHRYTVVNYCFGRLSTVEHRLLPMMDTPDQAVRAIQELIDVTNAYLVVTGKREDKLTGHVRDDGATEVEVKHTRV